MITNISVHDSWETLEFNVSSFQRRLDGGSIQGTSGYAGKCRKPLVKNSQSWRNWIELLCLTALSVDTEVSNRALQYL